MKKSLSFCVGYLDSIRGRVTGQQEPGLCPILSLHGLMDICTLQDYWWEEQMSSFPLRYRKESSVGEDTLLLWTQNTHLTGSNSLFLG